MAEDIASKIKRLRLKKGLTLEQVANYVGVGKSTVRKWETGMIANMKRDKIASLAEVLDTTPSFLMGWTEDDTFTKQQARDIVDALPLDLLTDDELEKLVEYAEFLVSQRKKKE